MYRLLAVDDDSMMLKLVQRLLKPEGYEVLCCSSGHAALDAAPRDKPDLIILDVNLPDMEGHEVCQRLKADARTKHIPILMLTGEAREIESRVQALDLGAEDYLFKPINGQVLTARIKALLKITAKPTK